MSRFLILSVLALLLLVPQTQAQKAADDADQELVQQVNRSIERGVQWLRTNHDPQTHWEGIVIGLLADMHGGTTSLATLALLNCGVDPDTREVRSAMEYLRGLPREKTYVVSLTTMVYAQAQKPTDLGRIQGNVDWLLKNAVRRNGKIIGWTYPRGESAPPDGSNTQYALLGLYAGKQAGAKIDNSTWKEIEQLYTEGMTEASPTTGYWQYEEKGPLTGASFTMTVAGVSGLVIANMALGESQQKLDPKTGIAANCGIYPANSTIQKGLNWIAEHFSFRDAKKSHSVFYNIYGIERVGRLSGERFLGDHDWYREGCQFLVEIQKPGGSWELSSSSFDTESISTSFSLLFLSKGRTPIIISKLAWGDALLRQGQLIEKSGKPDLIEWNRKRNDARNLTEFASRELFDGLPLGWQIYDPRRLKLNSDEQINDEVGVLVQSPILYVNGHEAPRLTGQQEKLLKGYIEEGGFVIAESCCGSPEFTVGFRKLMKKLFPSSPLQPMKPEHAIWRSFFAVPPNLFPDVESMEQGCRTVVFFSPTPMAGYWEEPQFQVGKDEGQLKSDAPLYRGTQATRLALNVIAYATGLEPPKQRLSIKRIRKQSDRSPPNGFLKPAQIRLPGETPPAPAAMRNLMTHLEAAAKLDVVLETETLYPDNRSLFKYKFMYMHGRKQFDLDGESIKNIKVNLQTGALLFADACCGREPFDESFRAMVKEMFPDSPLVRIPADDPIFSGDYNGGKPLTTVKRREKASGENDVTGYQELPPYLEGIKIDGRWAIIYSKYDIGCALEGHMSSDCLGYTRESALQIATMAFLYALKQ